MINEEAQIYHVRCMFLRCLSCLALSPIYLNLKHRMHIIAIEYSYSKVTIYMDLCAFPAGSARLWVIYPIILVHWLVCEPAFLCRHIRGLAYVLHDTQDASTSISITLSCSHICWD